MLTWRGTPTKQLTFDDYIAANTEQELFEHRENMLIYYMLFRTDYAKMQFKIYVNGNLLQWQWYPSGVSFRIYDQYELFGGKNVGHGLVVREYNTTTNNYVAEINTPIVVIRPLNVDEEGFKIVVNNDSSDSQQVQVAVFFVEFP